MSKVEKKAILSELKRYKKAYEILMGYFDSWSNEIREEVDKELKKVDL